MAELFFSLQNMEIVQTEFLWFCEVRLHQQKHGRRTGRAAEREPSIACIRLSA
jgi:hypothetical protein